jgi:NMD protein affecting ribosome stability and mRNA decay
MTAIPPIRHQHTATITHVLRQRQGVPYEIERVVCEACKKLLAEHNVRRAAA